MKKHVIILLLAAFISNSYSQDKQSDDLSVFIESLTSPEFVKAVEKSNGTCIIPMGILEKHGPHLPLFSDLIQAKEISVRAAKQEYALVFPDYYFGQIFEAKHQPGTFSYSEQLIWKLLQETCDELSRNGINRIVIVNGHGGNVNFLNYFCQAQLSEKRDYAVVLFNPDTEVLYNNINKLMRSDSDYHAGEIESSVVYSIHPELVDTSIATSESGADMARLDSMPNAYAGIWWYAKFPNHYAGDGSILNKEIAELMLEEKSRQLIELLKYIKHTDEIFELQDEFFERSQNPIGN